MAVASRYGTSIISADSRQCYREMNMGVAKPSPKELEQVFHYFINSHSIQEEVTAASFENYALTAMAAIFKDKDVAVMVGGTGLYIKAFCEGLDSIPPVDKIIREEIIRNYEQRGLPWLQYELQKLDPVYFDSGEIQNPQRLMRALEVVMATGFSIRHFQRGEKEKRDFNIIKIGLTLPRDVLYDRINIRVDTMVRDGLVEEVKGLLPYKHLTALQTVGYSELFDYLDKKISLEEAITAIKKNTRHYAKRQETWFRKDPGIISFPATAEKEVFAYIDAQLSKDD